MIFTNFLKFLWLILLHPEDLRCCEACGKRNICCIPVKVCLSDHCVQIFCLFRLYVRHSRGSPDGSHYHLYQVLLRPCIWPPKPIPATFACRYPSVSSFIPSMLWVNQSSGFCSDQPGWGKNSGYSLIRCCRIFPDSSIRRSFTAEVPRSTPI